MSATVADAPALPLKLLAYALDPAALDGEAETAAVRFIRAARREGITIEVLAEHLRTAPSHVQPEQKLLRRPPACRVKMPHRKYAGMCLLRIGTEDLQYLQWMAECHTDGLLASAAAAVLAWMLPDLGEQ